MFVRSLAIGVSAAALMVGGAQAADLIIPTTPQPIAPIASGFDWEGIYAGARVGGQWVGSAQYGNAVVGERTNGVLGVAAGVNFLPVDPVLLGLEVSGDWLWNDQYSSGEFFANLRAGAVVTDNALVYAIGGVGFQAREGRDNAGIYQLGAGVEFAVTDAVTLRGEVVGQGAFDKNGSDDFFRSTKATVGAFYHF